MHTLLSRSWIIRIVCVLGLLIASSPSFATINFGSIALGARLTKTLKARYVDILNPDSTIQITSVTLNAAAARAFTIKAAPIGLKVKSGDTFQITAEFSPGAPGTYQGTVIIKAKPVLRNGLGSERTYGQLAIRGDGLDLSVTAIETSSYPQRVSTPTFVSTDEIRVTFGIGANVPGILSDVALTGYVVYPNGAAVAIGTWDLKAKEQPVGRWGYVTASSTGGKIQVTFVPEWLPGLHNDRVAKWTGGSYTANPALRFDVECQLDVFGAEQETAYTSVMESGLAMPTQDEIDTLRQEYIDLSVSGKPIPERRDFIAALDPPESTNSPVAGYNAGNYHVQLGSQLVARFGTLLDRFRGRTVITASGKPLLIDGKTVQIPANATLTVSCGFRCPQRETKILGHTSPISRHTLGRALDVKPSTPVTVVVGGHWVTLDLYQHIYPTLLQAAKSMSEYAQLENSQVQVAPGQAADHCHLQW